MELQSHGATGGWFPGHRSGLSDTEFVATCGHIEGVVGRGSKERKGSQGKAEDRTHGD